MNDQEKIVLYISDEKKSNVSINYALCLILGYKTFETRTRNVFKSIFGTGKLSKFVEIARKKTDGTAEIIGNGVLCRGEKRDAAWMLYHQADTLVSPGSRFWSDAGKWVYAFIPCERYETPRPIPQKKINHGRSYFGYIAE